MIEKEHINEAAETHGTLGRGYSAPSFKCGAEWALREVTDILKDINLNEFIVGKISFPVHGARHCQLEFINGFLELLIVAVEYGVDIRHLSPVERQNLLNKNFVL